jgi:hypothetical protein
MGSVQSMALSNAPPARQQGRAWLVDERGLAIESRRLILNGFPLYLSAFHK